MPSFCVPKNSSFIATFAKITSCGRYAFSVYNKGGRKPSFFVTCSLATFSCPWLPFSPFAFGLSAYSQHPSPGWCAKTVWGTWPCVRIWIGQW